MYYEYLVSGRGIHKDSILSYLKVADIPDCGCNLYQRLLQSIGFCVHPLGHLRRPDQFVESSMDEECHIGHMIPP